MTCALTTGVVLMLIAVQSAVVAAFAGVQLLHNPEADFDALLDGITHNGLMLAVAGIVSAPVAIGVVLICVIGRVGAGVSDYLGLSMPSFRAIAAWTLLLIGYEVFVALIAMLFQTPDNAAAKFMTETYASAGFPPLLWLSMILCVPLAEETVFRGFMHPGIAESPAGPAFAIVLTSVCWSALHVQYDIGTIAAIFGMGILLGAARHVTGSLWTPIAMHVVWNGLATLQTELYLRTLPPV